MVQYVVTLEVTMEADTPGTALAAAEMAAWLVPNVQAVKADVKQGHVPMDKLSDEQVLQLGNAAYRIVEQNSSFGSEKERIKNQKASKKYSEMFLELERRSYDAMDSLLSGKLVRK